MAKNKKRKVDFSKIRGVAYLLISVGFVGVFVSQYFNTINLQQIQMNEVIKQKELLEKEKAAIQQEIDLLSNEDYITRYARENYVFTKEGETVVILPQNEE